MYKFKKHLVWCLLVGTIVSCSKKADPEPEPDPVVVQDYQPTTAGSTWTYGGTYPYTFTATGATKVIGGKTYAELETKQGSSTTKSYLLKENGMYTAVGMVPNSGTLEIIILKEAAAVGESWQHASTDNMGIESKRVMTIVEKNIKKTVEGKTYDNTIHVKMASSFVFMDIEFGEAIVTHYYFAKGVGLILSHDEGDLGGITASLLTYTIK